MTGNTKKSFNPRAFTSVLAGLSFILMVVTGLVLFIAPSCRIARDTSWTVLGHDKDQWVAVHVWLSIAFTIASVIHIYLNWKVLISYFKSKVRKGWAFRAEWLAALAICAVLYAGSAAEVPPFSSVMAWKETFKHPEGEGSGRGAGQGRGRGAGRQLQNLDGEAGPAGIDEQHGDIEQHLTSGHGPGRAGGGMGRMTLKQFCSDEGVDLAWAIMRLRNEGFTAASTMTMRQIADGSGVHPRELRDILGLKEDHDR
jgi:hypothetical protein